tara:strand:- start:22 stop:279 length:258 start_codon:yes stop_codon:yes gene_type:complete
MYKKTIFTLLLFLSPVAFIEHIKKDSGSKIINNKYDIIKINDLHFTDSLFKDDENRIEIKNCWEKGDLLSQKRYCSAKENVFHNF